jgi:hypothetical protein
MPDLVEAAGPALPPFLHMLPPRLPSGRSSMDRTCASPDWKGQHEMSSSEQSGRPVDLRVESSTALHQLVASKEFRFRIVAAMADRAIEGIDVGRVLVALGWGRPRAEKPKRS